MKLAGKVAFVTGGAGGIGQAMAQAFVQAGASVVIADIDEARLQTAKARLASEDCVVGIQKLDVTDRQSWLVAFEKVEADYGVINVLCNNAGVSVEGTVECVDPLQWERIMAINVTGAFHGAQCFIAHARRHRQEAHIVNTGSVAGLFTIPGFSAYTVSKYAMVGLSETLRLELQNTRINISVLCPGLVDTDLGVNSNSVLDIADMDDMPLTASSMSPYFVGQKVAEAIEHNRFYIFTHPEYRKVLEARHRVMLGDVGESAQSGYTEDITPLGASWFALDEMLR